MAYIRNKKILLVDDDPLIVRSTALLLKSIGHDVSVATEGQSAIRLFNENIFDAIIIDLSMLPMSGFDISKVIKAISPDCNIIISTGFLEDADIKLLATINITNFLLKPYSLSELSHILECSMGS